jgi:hypothetical protein
MLRAMGASGVIRRFCTAAAAREALLVGRGRLAVDSDALPSAVRAGIRETFGQDLSAEQVVQRVIKDVRTQGDKALRHGRVRPGRCRRPARICIADQRGG